MQTHSRLGRRAASLIALLLAVAGFVRAQDAEPSSGTEPVFRVQSPRGRMQIIERFAKIVEMKDKIARVDGFDPEILDVSGVQMHPNRIRVHALAPGVTTLVLVDEHDQTHTVEVFVGGDVRHLQAYISRVFPHAAVEATEIRDAVMLRGWVTQPEHITEMVEIAEQFYPKVLNHLQVGGSQQVQLKVKIMEVQRSKIRRLGFNFLHLGPDGFVASTPGQLTPLATASTPLGATPTVAVNPARLVDPTLAFGIIKDNSIFQGFIEALKEESLLKILAEPTLNTSNGRPAQMLVGGEFPILVPQSLGTVTIEFREFGVRMEAVPHMLGNGRVRLELQPEVSDRDLTNAVTISGITVPGLTTRRVNTSVEMRFGETYVLAGLISWSKTAETSKVPFLGELPYLGALFRRESFSESETEMVIMVTPELAGPLQTCQVPPGGPGLFSSTPTDREFGWYGLLEVPDYGDECVGHPGGCPPPAYGGMTGAAPFGPPPAGAYPAEPAPYGRGYDGSPQDPGAPPAPGVPPAPSAFPPGLIVPPEAAPAGPDPAAGPELERTGYYHRDSIPRLQGQRSHPAAAGSAPRGPGAIPPDRAPHHDPAWTPAASSGRSMNPPGRPGLIGPRSGMIEPTGTRQR
ncbi:MAG: pilus assembly protein N-terminal domain-containing protein [Planctomycetales bacterium]